MCPLRWSVALHLVLLCWLAAALQVIEGKIHAAAALPHHCYCEEIYSCEENKRAQTVWHWPNRCFIIGTLHVDHTVQNCMPMGSN